MSKNWTSIEDDFLKKEYAKGVLNAKQIGEILGRSANGVGARAIRIGVKFGQNVEIPDGHKRCSRCRGTFPKEQFSKNNKNVDGLGGYCSSCVKVISKEIQDRYLEIQKNAEPKTEKTCAKCGHTKPISSFWKTTYSKDGYRSACSMCETLRRQLKQDSKKE